MKLASEFATVIMRPGARSGPNGVRDKIAEYRRTDLFDIVATGMTSDLLKLRTWLTLEEAADYLSSMTGLNVEEGSSTHSPTGLGWQASTVCESPETHASNPRLHIGKLKVDSTALLHGPEQIADLPVPVAESPGAVRIGHPERSHLVEYLAPNSVFNSLPRQRSSPHLRPDDRLVTIDRVLHHASLGVA